MEQYVLISLVVFIVCGFSFGVYMVWCGISAYVETKAAPREKGYICPKHGPIRKKDLMNLCANPVLNTMNDEENPVDMCVFCFNDRMKKLHETQKEILKKA